MKSPFRFGTEATAADLVDREAELAEVLWTIEGRDRLFLIGPRRFGKTSILSSATAIARARGDIVVQVNAEEFASLSALAAEIVRQAGEQLRSPLATAVERAKALFAALNPQITYDPIGNAWSVGVTARSDARETTYLADALESLDALAAEVERPVALIIDEFQRVVKAEGLDAERQLRAIIQRHQHVAYVFAGSAESMLLAMTGDHARPFYRLGSRRFLGPVPRADFRAHIVRGFGLIHLTIAPEAVEAVLELAGDVPYSVQRLANVAWRTAVVEGHGGEVGRDHIEAALAHLLQTEAPDYGATLSELTPSQVKALVAVARVGGAALTSSATARRFGLAQSTLRRGLEALEARNLIRRVYDGDPTRRYAFEDPFFREWVRRRVKF